MPLPPLVLASVITVSLLVSGCSLADRSRSDQLTETKRDLPSYPVDPYVHVSGSHEGPVNPGAVRPVLANAVAYARYGLGLVGQHPTADSPPSVETVLEGWVQAAEKAALPPASALSFSRWSANEQQRTQLLETLHAESPAHERPKELSKVQSKLADLTSGLRACEEAGYEPTECCTAIGFFAALSRTEQLENVDDQTMDVGWYRTWATARLQDEKDAVARGDRATIQPFVHLGLRGWLGACGPTLAQTPVSLEALRHQYGDWYQAAGWVRELHPVSLAKHAGRRIHRRKLPGGTIVSIAESLAEDCSVKETEVIVSRPDGSTRFSSYGPEGSLVPHGLFPAGKGREIVKLTPESCMGCHYTFDERRFTVVAPSFEALGLGLTVRDGQPEWRDDIECQTPQDTIVEHDATVRHVGSAH